METCARHLTLTRKSDDFGWPVCAHCFTEAREYAEAKALEERIARLRAVDQSSVAYLVARLGWIE